MRNSLDWQPTKFVREKGRLRASSDRALLAPQSRIVADLVAQAYAEALPQHARGDLIDLGCGLVPLYGEYSSHVSSVVTADWPMSHHPQPYTDVFLDLGNSLPLGDSTFDTVILSDVLEHVPRPEYLWSEVCRLLRAGGKIIGNTPFLYPIHEEPHDFFRYTEYGIRNSVDFAGMRLEGLVAVGGYVDLMGDLLAKGLAQGGAIGRALAVLTARTILGFSRTSVGRRARERSSSKFPLGYLFIASKPGNGEMLRK